MRALPRFILPAASVMLASLAPVLEAAEAPAPIKSEFVSMTSALANGDFEAFLANGSDEAKAKFTREMFDAVAGPIGPRFKAGFDAEFLANLKAQGCEVYVWKVTFKDGGDDYLVRLAMENGRVAGFKIQ